MAIEHSAIPDNGLHEPLGVATASQYQAYIADGAGSGDWTNILPAKQVLVNSLSDLPAPVAGVIMLETNKIYVLGSDVYLANNRIDAGDSTALIGLDNIAATITYTGTGDMITVNNVSWRISRVTLSAVNGRVFNVNYTSPRVFRTEGVVISSCNKVGLFNSTSSSTVLRFSEFTVVNAAADGLEFTGSWGTLFYDVSIAIISGGALFNLGAATFNTIIIKGTEVTLAASTYLIDGAAGSANINAGGAGIVLYCPLSGTGASNPLNGVTTEDALWLFDNSPDIADTRADGLLSMTGNATATTIGVAGTFYLVAGTWTVQRDSQFTGTAAGRLTYNGGRSTIVPISASVSVAPSSGTNKNIRVVIAKNGSPITASRAQVNTDAGVPLSMTCIWQLELAPSDYVEVFVTNSTDTVSVVVSDAVFRVN